ncbi:UNVERIFIED_CONTAM: hypothetical protein Slati_3219300 [Sesamum latifolium]|uniref:Uncharacterized protein n=1 Tax=Sesamum latifolium TaxID=2727402 RepID=A0AAW2UZ98_9LAMI
MLISSNSTIETEKTPMDKCRRRNIKGSFRFSTRASFLLVTGGKPVSPVTNHVTVAPLVMSSNHFREIFAVPCNSVFAGMIAYFAD